MKLFDLHCDTIERMEEKGENMLTDKTQLSLKYLPQIEKWCQTFAIFIPDSKRGAAAVEYYERVRAYFHKMLREHSDIVEMVNTPSDIEKITAKKKCAAILSVEGAAVLDGKLENVEKLAKDGVKMMTLTWNGENELASGNKNPEMGFTDFGREAVKEMEKQNIIVDVSHLNDKSMEQLMGGIATKPIIATHSNLRSICSHKRNLTEEGCSSWAARMSSPAEATLMAASKARWTTLQNLRPLATICWKTASAVGSSIRLCLRMRCTSLRKMSDDEK